MTEKIVGYSLLIAGVLIILFCALNMVLVFTGRAEPVQLFHTSGISLDLGSLISAQLPGALRPAAGAASQKTEIFPAQSFDLISNLTVQVILMGFLAGIGQKLANLGVQLLRPVTVKVDGKDLLSSAS